MIPPDVANSLRTILPDVQQQTNARTQAQPIQAAQRVADVLSDLVPGQRIMAEIQALLPNGNYRAVVAQREFTLALPFSAKAGDTLELEVQETDGKLTFAVVANRDEAAAGKNLDPSVPTTFSRAGQVIRDLLGEINPEAGKKAPPAMLNGNQPIMADAKADPLEIAANLKQAVSQSGVFYESHQAKWAAGQLPTEALRAEPQGKIAVPAVPLPASTTTLATDKSGVLATLTQSSASSVSSQENTQSAATPNSLGTPSGAVDSDSPLQAKTVDNSAGSADKAPGGASPLHRDGAGTSQTAREATVSTASNLSSARLDTGLSGQPGGVPREIVPIVQQQLDGLASQQFAWQGQAWPGQAMQWEIEDNRQGGAQTDDPEQRYWQTRLRLSLPSLGGVDAVLRLRANGELGIDISTNSSTGESRMAAATPDLRAQVEAAGLNLVQVQIRRD